MLNYHLIHNISPNWTGIIIVLFLGEVILPTSTVPHNAYPEVKHMTSVEIKHSKYGPHRFSNSDEPSDSGSDDDNNNEESHNDVVFHINDTGSLDDFQNIRSHGTGSHGDESHVRDVVRSRVASLRGVTSETDLGLRVC